MRPLTVISGTALIGGLALIAFAASGAGSAGASVGAAIPGIVMVLAGGTGLTGLLNNGYFQNKSGSEKAEFQRVAGDRGIKLGTWARSEAQFQSATVVGGQGNCPLALLNGVQIDVSPLGRLNMPLCEPAILAIERTQAARHFGMSISTACVCPLGDQSVSFRLEPART